MLARWLLILPFLFACTNNSQQASLVRARAFSDANEHVRTIAEAVENKDPASLPAPDVLVNQLKNYLTILNEVSHEHDYPMASYFEAVYFAVTHTSDALYLLGEGDQAQKLMLQLEPYLNETHLFGKLKIFHAERAVEENRLGDAVREFESAAIFLATLPSYDGASTRLWLCDAWLKSAIQNYRIDQPQAAFDALQHYINACIEYELHIHGLGHAYGAFLGMLSSDVFEPDPDVVNATFARIEEAVDFQRQKKLLDHPDLTEPDTPARQAFERFMSKRFQANLDLHGAFSI